MKADELPEETNNPKPQGSGEVNPPPLSSLSDSPLTSETTAFPINPANNTEELIIAQDASTPEKVPIIESPDFKSAGESQPPENVAAAANQSTSFPSELESQEDIANLAATEDKTELEEIEASSSQPITVAQNATESTRVESQPFPVDTTVSSSVATGIESSKLETQVTTPEPNQQSPVDVAATSSQSTSFPSELESQEDIANLAATEDKTELEEIEASSSQPIAVAQNATEATRQESVPSQIDATVSSSPTTGIESSKLETQVTTPKQTQQSPVDVAAAANQSTSFPPELESQEDIANLAATEDKTELEEIEASSSQPVAVEQNATESTRVESQPFPVDTTVNSSVATEIEPSILGTQVIQPEPNQQSPVDVAATSSQSISFPQTPESQKNIDSVSVTSAAPVEAEDAPMRIFITGASGCIGHYIVETLIEKTDYELYLLVRNPNKLKFDCNVRPGIHIVQGDMREIKRFGKLLKTMNCVVLAAAGWGGQEAVDVNVFKTIELLNLLNPKVCHNIIYFSTASVLDRQNKLLKEAGQAGTAYIRSKYDFLRQVTRVPIAKRITTVFPTLVLGGDEKHPYSHVSGGLPDLMKETEILRLFNKPLLKVKPIDLIKFFQADGSFHFIHARDIAQVVRYLIDHPPESLDSRWLVLGNEPVTLNQVIEEACAYLNKPISYRFNLSPWIANIFIRLFRIQMSAWDRFSFEYRHFTYQNPVNPSTFGMPVYCPELIDVLKLSGISRRG